MPKFYTHLFDNDGFHSDEDGVEFPDLEAARRSAIAAGADIAAEEITRGRTMVTLLFYIDDDSRQRVDAITVIASVSAPANEC